MSRKKHLPGIVDPKPGRPRTFSAKSQGLVEFALILPVLLLTIFVIVELARVLHAWLAIENGARFGVRYAVTQEYDLAYCSAVVDDKCGDPDEVPFAQIQSIKDAAKSGAVAILRTAGAGWDQPGYFKVTVCPNDPNDPDNPYERPDPDIPFDSADCIGGDDPGEPGEFISVTVDFNHPLITPMLTAVWPQLHLHSRREAIVEEFRTSRVVDPPEGLPTLVPTNTFTATPTFTPSLTPTNTITPSPTFTPTPTPSPSCSNIFRVGQRINGDDFEIRVQNNNVAPAFLSSAFFEWPIAPPGVFVDKFSFDGSRYWSGDDFSSPTGPISSWERLNGGGDRAWWEVDFDNGPSPFWGTFSADLVFGFDGIGLTCTISGSASQVQLPTNTPRPPAATNTPGPSPTPKPTNTPRPPTNTPGPATDTPPPTSTDPSPTEPPPGD
jgi:hypothetical protein